MEKKVLEFDLDIPRLRINAQYDLKGQILLLPIVGNGDVAMTLKNVKTRVVTQFSLQNLPEVSIYFFLFLTRGHLTTCAMNEISSFVGSNYFLLFCLFKYIMLRIIKL